MLNTSGRMPSSSEASLIWRTASFARSIESHEGQGRLLELDILELGEEAVAEHFGRDAGAIGDEEGVAKVRVFHGLAALQ